MHRSRIASERRSVGASERRSVGASERRSVGASERNTRVSDCSSATVERGNPICRVRGATFHCVKTPRHIPNAGQNCGGVKPTGRGAISYSCVQIHIAPVQRTIGAVHPRFAPSHSPVGPVQTKLAPVQFQIIGCNPALHRRTPVLARCNFILHRCKTKLHRRSTEKSPLSIQLPRGIPPLAVRKPGIA